MAQHQVDPRNRYERVLAIVPWTGSGTMADPKRPLYAPQTASAVSPQAVDRSTGILAYHCTASDDGKVALCEFIAVHRAALQPIMADASVTSFLKGRDTVAGIVAEFKKYKKDFDISKFVMAVQ
jgi:hypothetical protein